MVTGRPAASPAALTTERKTSAFLPPAGLRPGAGRHRAGYACRAYAGEVIELRHLAYFRAVAESSSIARAAAALNMTQPALSRQITQLERSVGYPLLRRTARGTSLTPAGEGLRAHVSVIFAEIDRIPDILRAAGTAQRLIRVGIPPGVPTHWFDLVLSELSTSLPGVRPVLHEATSEEQRRLLHAGLLDIGIIHLEPADLPSTLVISQPFGCVVRPESGLATAPSVRLEDLQGLRVMAHSAQENYSQEMRLRATAETRALQISWVFRSFADHSDLIVRTSEVDAVLVSEASAVRQFPSWPWIPIDQSDTVNAQMRTWAAWRDPQLAGLRECLDAMRRASTLTPGLQDGADR